MAADKHTTFVQLAFSFTEPEEWRPVVGWEGFYEVSNLGRVRSLDRHFIDHAGKRRFFKGQLLHVFAQQGTKYNIKRRKVRLRNQERNAYRFVHHVVLEAFVGPRPEGYATNHIDGDPTNNRISNLAWVTYAENNRHSLATGLTKQYGATHSGAIFTDADILLIRRLHTQGMSQSDIARQFSASLSVVHSIIKRRGWKHIPEEV